MPIFEYQCEACGHRFDVLERAGEAAQRKCPECGRLRLRKLLSAPGFQLRGSGWRKPSAKSPGNGASRLRRVGHTLDSGPPHSHDDHHGHDERSHTHSHGPGHRDDHKH